MAPMPPDPIMSEGALAYVWETAPVLALRLDAQQHVVAANAHALRVLSREVVGRTMAELVVDFTNSVNLPALIARTDGVHLLTLNTVAGVPESYQFRFFPLPAGTLALGGLDFQEQSRLRTGMLEMNRELNDLTRRLHQANAELRELNQLKNRFLGMAAHDLRKPVGIMMTYLEFVLDEAGKQLSAQHEEFLNICLAAAMSMKRLIDDFLDLAIIESGNLRLDLALADDSEIMAGAEPMARLIAGRKQVILLVDLAKDARRLRVDVSKFQQVLLNLVGNAVEHSMPGQRVWVSSRWDDQNLVFTVRDQGPGIAPEDQPRLFTAFARAGTRKTAGEPSVGLGLAIARLVVEAHGGRISVASLPGQGATFQVALPGQTPPFPPASTRP